MGMFDSFIDANDNDWQTKAYGRNLEEWSVGDDVPPLTPDLADYQVEILGDPQEDDGDYVWSLATVRAGRLVSIHDERDRKLPMFNYSGHLQEPA